MKRNESELTHAIMEQNCWLHYVLCTLRYILRDFGCSFNTLWHYPVFLFAHKLIYILRVNNEFSHDFELGFRFDWLVKLVCNAALLAYFLLPFSVCYMKCTNIGIPICSRAPANVTSFNNSYYKSSGYGYSCHCVINVYNFCFVE